MQQKKHLGDGGVAEEKEWDCPVSPVGDEGPDHSKRCWLVCEAMMSP